MNVFVFRLYIVYDYVFKTSEDKRRRFKISVLFLFIFNRILYYVLCFIFAQGAGTRVFLFLCEQQINNYYYYYYYYLYAMVK